MGRYITGDINRKLWFALQSSDAASRFGGEETEPTYISYSFEQEHLEELEAEIKRIEDSLGNKLRVIEEFFRVNNGYNDDMLEEAGIHNHEVSEYADLLLGIDIRNCVIEKGSCYFDAEI